MGKLSQLPDRVCFSVDEIAHAHGVSPALVRLEIARGNLRANRFGKRIVIPRDALDDYWKKRAVRGLR